MCWAAYRLCHHPEPSGCAVHNVDVLDIGGQHARRSVLLRHHRKPQRRPCPSVQAGVETSDTCAEAFKPDPGYSSEGHYKGWVPMSRMKVRSLVGLSAHSTFHWLFSQCTTRMLSHKLMICGARFQMGVSIWDAVLLHSMDRQALSGAGV